MNQRNSGRTTRMLQYAIQRWRNRMPTTLVGKDLGHARVLESMLETVLTERDKKNADQLENIGIISLSDMISCSWQDSRNAYGALRGYNYATNRFTANSSELEIVFDHFTMESHLKTVIAYLKAAEYISDVDAWVLQTARIFSVTSNVQVVVAPEQVAEFSDLLERQDVEVVSESTNIDYVNLRSRKPVVTTPHQLVFHPAYLSQRFAGALSTITRF